jgi:CIC family chloride channel protein
VFALFFNTLGISEHQLSLSNFSLVGMAGLMAGVLHAPLTAIFLIAEITSGHELFHPPNDYCCHFLFDHKKIHSF